MGVMLDDFFEIAMPKIEVGVKMLWGVMFASLADFYSMVIFAVCQNSYMYCFFFFFKSET